MEPKVEPLGCDYPEEDDDQVSFVTNLFNRSSEYDPTSDSPARLSLGEGIGGSRGVDLEFGLGLYSEGSVAPPSQSTEETRRFAVLHVVSVDSDSDSDDGSLPDFDEIDGLGGVNDFDPPPFSWDGLEFSNQRNNRANDELLGIDFSSQIHEREIELPGIATHNEDDGGDFFFGRCHDGFDDDDDDDESPIQLDTDDTEREIRDVPFMLDAYQDREELEITIQSDTSALDYSVEEAIQDLEWEITMAVNNFNQEVYVRDVNVDMYDAIVGEMPERMNDRRESPLASDSVIENLPTVCLSADCLEENNIVCAICKDDISEEEKVRQLPCSHYYHGDCILPWLKMRNTCPVCRHELPTDDPEYEYSKRYSDFTG